MEVLKKTDTIKNYQCPHLVWAAGGRKSPSRFDFKRFRKNRHKKYKCPIVKQEKLNK